MPLVSKESICMTTRSLKSALRQEKNFRGGLAPVALLSLKMDESISGGEKVVDFVSCGVGLELCGERGGVKENERGEKGEQQSEVVPFLRLTTQRNALNLL